MSLAKTVVIETRIIKNKSTSLEDDCFRYLGMRQLKYENYHCFCMHF